MSRSGESDSFANQPVVIDNGSGLLKAGFAGAEMPKVLFPAYVGRPKHVRVMAGAAEGDVFVGDGAKELRGLLKLNYPTKHGITTDWEDMHHVWQHCFSELGVVVDQHPVLLTEAALNPSSQRGKAAELFFETFAVPAFYVESQAILALYASGRTTGVVLDSGDGVSVAVPVVEGFVIPHAVNRIDIAGRDVTQYLQRLLRKAGHHFHTTAELEVVKDIKEKMSPRNTTKALCYVAYNIDAHDKDDTDDVEPEVPYKLPDGSVLSVSSEKYRAPELLFHPSLIGSEEAGVHSMLCQSIASCDLDVRRSLFSSIILSGGSTLFDGFGDRLLSECRRLAPRDTKIKIWAPPERILSTWIGGSILASLATFKRMWVTRKDYEEHGKSIMHRRGLG